MNGEWVVNMFEGVVHDIVWGSDQANKVARLCNVENASQLIELSGAGTRLLDEYRGQQQPQPSIGSGPAVPMVESSMAERPVSTAPPDVMRQAILREVNSM